MKIERVTVTPIAISDPPLLNAAGLHAPYALRIVLELETNDGVTGVSEIPGNVETEELLNSVQDLLDGADPFQLNALHRSLIERAASKSSPGGPEDSRGAASWDARKLVHVRSAVEVACLDIIGKATGRPVCDLLGGAVREKVDFAAYLFFKERGAGGSLGFDIDPEASGWSGARQEEATSPEAIVRQAEAMCRRYGFKSIKLKGGALSPDEEAASILALREAFGAGVPLRLDPNAIWSFETAVRIGKKLEGTLEYYEDPVRGQQQMARLADHLSLPRATNMCTTSFDDLPSSIELDSEEIILADHHFWGGPRACVELGRICETFGRGMSMHSNSHLGISLSAMLHLAAAVPVLTYALDTHYPWQSEEVIRGGRFELEEGALPAPTEPGLGVEIDRTALSKLHKQYLDCGLKRRDDEAEMRKLYPSWTFESTRW